MTTGSRMPLGSGGQGVPANARTKTCTTRCHHPSAHGASKEALWVVRSLAVSPRLVDQRMAAKAGGPCMPETITVSQCRPSTNIGGPPGGLKKPGLMRFNRAALLERTGHSPSTAMLSGFSKTLSSQMAKAVSPVSSSRPRA